MDNIIKTYERIRKHLKAYQYVLRLINWDSATEAPKGCFEYRGKQIGVISEQLHKIITSSEYQSCIETLSKRIDDLEPVLAHEIIEAKKDLDKILKIPLYEYVDYQILLSSSQEKWIEAKKNEDYKLFAPTLEKIVAYQRKFIKYFETDILKGYDVLLDNYEPGFTTKDYDEFFSLLEEKLLPLYQKFSEEELSYNQSFNDLHYPIAKQKQFCHYLQDVLCFDRHRGLMKESEHPFTSSVDTTDVRFTVHYYEDDFTSSIFSAIHELGHAIYYQQINPQLNDTNCNDGASIAMHESQSRLYENMIGRSLTFWKTHFPKLQALFPEQLQNITVDDFYRLINQTKRSYIRVDADELSYPFHIILRYNLEKGLIEGKYQVQDLDKIWNQKFKNLFGIEVRKPSEGILQDMHWSAGMFGYFPTYALGSAYAAQIYHYMAQEIEIDKSIASGTTAEINSWLKDKIHHYGGTLYPKELLTLIINEEFNPNYYLEYLKEKYQKLYAK